MKAPTGGRVAVVGGGAWGTALADLLARGDSSVRLWAREPEVVESIRERRENAEYLKGLKLCAELGATSSLEGALAGAGVVIWTCPVQYSSALLARAREHILPEAIVVSASKGIEVETLRPMHELLGAHLSPGQSRRVCALSGPSFASEVVARVPTAVVAASRDQGARRHVQSLFQTDRFRVYTNRDLIGVELGGALKNVIALAAGVAAGLELGHNTVAALITRGLAEIGRLGVAMGASAGTFAGLAGMGDLVLTCTGGASRNRQVGERLGRGESMEEIMAGMNTVAEGVATAHAVRDLSRRHGVEMPVSTEVYAIVVQGRDPMEALDRLMTREPTSEAPIASPNTERG